MAAEAKPGDLYCRWCHGLVAVEDSGGKPMVLIPYVQESGLTLCLKDYSMLRKMHGFVMTRGRVQ